MNKKHAENHIRKKVNDWLNSLPKEIAGGDKRKILWDNIIVTGGCIPSLLMGNTVNDYDIYFVNPRVLEQLINYYIKEFKEITNLDRAISILIDEERLRIKIKSAGIASIGEDESKEGYQYFEQTDDDSAGRFIEEAYELAKIGGTKLKELREDSKKYFPVFMSENAMALDGKIQLITRFTGSVRDIHKNFDFIHVTNYWHRGRLVTKRGALESILAKELYYVNSLYPVAAFFRVRKFLNRGWHINAGQMLKIAFAISKLDLADISILREQLIGVDMYYFRELVSFLQKQMEEEGAKTIDETYLMELIDRIF